MPQRVTTGELIAYLLIFVSIFLIAVYGLRLLPLGW